MNVGSIAGALNAAAPSTLTWSHFKCEQGVAARGRYSCTPFSRSPVLGSGINLCSQPETNSSREQIKAAAARPAPAAGPKPTPSRLYPGAELLAGQYRRCAGFASFDELKRQTLPAFQTRPSARSAPCSVPVSKNCDGFGQCDNWWILRRGWVLSSVAGCFGPDTAPAANMENRMR